MGTVKAPKPKAEAPKPTPKAGARVTPPNITELADDEVFVFGSNLAGIHGAGAAKTAAEKFGAVRGSTGGEGQPIGSQSYALPTKKTPWVQRSDEEIAKSVNTFIEYAKNHPESRFLVTAVGTGLARREGETAEQAITRMAKLFAAARDVQNISLPQQFWDVLNTMAGTPAPTPKVAPLDESSPEFDLSGVNPLGKASWAAFKINDIGALPPAIRERFVAAINTMRAKAPGLFRTAYESVLSPTPIPLPPRPAKRQSGACHNRAGITSDCRR